MEWEAAERTQTNSKTGERRAFAGGEWFAIEKSQTNKKSGERRVIRRAEVAAPPEAAVPEKKITNTSEASSWLENFNNQDNPEPSPEAPRPTGWTPPPEAPAPTSTAKQRNARRYDPKTGTYEAINEAGSRGFSAGTGGLSGLLQDLVAAPFRFAAKKGFPGAEELASQDYFANTQRNMKFTDNLFDVDRNMKPSGPGQEVLMTMTEFVTANLIPGGTIAKGAPNPSAVIQKEIASSAVAGAGSQIAGNKAEQAGFNRAWGEIPGAMVSPYAITKLEGAARKISGKAGNIKSSATEKSKKELEGIIKAEKLEEKIKDSVIVTDAVESVTGKSFKPTLAGRTQSSYIAQSENKVLGRDTASAERATVAHRENAETLESFVDATLPESGKSLQRIAADKVRKAVDKVDEAVSRATKGIDEAAEDLVQKRLALAEKYTGKDQQSTGQKIQDDLKVSEKEVKKSSDAEIEEIYQRADANKVTASMDDVVNELKKVKKDKGNLFQDMPAIFSDVLDRYMKVSPKSKLVDKDGKLLSKIKIPEASFREIHSLYKETNRLLRTSNSGFSNTQMHFLTKLKDSLSKKMTKFSTAKAGKVGEGITIWNKKYVDYVKTYREGAAGDALRQGKRGQLSPSKVTKKFFTPEGIDQYIKINANNPAAMANLEYGILDLFSTSAIKGTGKINPVQAAAFLEKNKLALSKLPKLEKQLKEAAKGADDLSKPGELITELTKRNARLAQAKKDVSNGLLAQIARTEDVGPVIERALTETSRKTFKVLNITGAEGRKAILHSIASAIPNVAKSQGMSGSDFLKKYKKNIKPILDRYGKEHYENIRVATASMDMLTYGKPPASPALTKFNKDVVEDLTGTSTKSMVSQIRLASTFLSPEYVAASLGSAFWRKLGGAKANKMQEYLLTHPDAARDFAGAMRDKTMTAKKLQNALNPHLYAAGVRAVTVPADGYSIDNKDK